jgi:hypothetical protein
LILGNFIFLNISSGKIDNAIIYQSDFNSESSDSEDKDTLLEKKQSEELIVQKNGFLYRPSNKTKKIKKFWFKLINKDLYCK